MLLKKSFLRHLLLRLLSLRRYVSSIYMYILHGSADDNVCPGYETKQSDGEVPSCFIAMNKLLDARIWEERKKLANRSLRGFSPDKLLAKI